MKLPEAGLSGLAVDVDQRACSRGGEGQALRHSHGVGHGIDGRIVLESPFLDTHLHAGRVNLADEDISREKMLAAVYLPYRVRSGLVSELLRALLFQGRACV